MKAAIFDRIKTTEEIQGDFSSNMIATGTEGVIVECYEDPEAYAIDLEFPDETLVGGFDYENVLLYPEQFIVLEKSIESDQNSDSGE